MQFTIYAFPAQIPYRRVHPLALIVKCSLVLGLVPPIPESASVPPPESPSSGTKTIFSSGNGDIDIRKGGIQIAVICETTSIINVFIRGLTPSLQFGSAPQKSKDRWGLIREGCQETFPTIGYLTDLGLAIKTE